MIDENMISKLVDKLENNQLNLAKIENKVASFEHNLAEINQKLVYTNYRTEKIEDHIANQIIQSRGKKTEIRWWHRLGDEISRTMNKVIEKVTGKMTDVQIFLSFFIFLPIIYLCHYLDYFNIKVIGYLYIAVLLIIFSIPLYVIVRDGYKIFKETSTISKIKTLTNDFKPFVGFLSVIFFLNITLFATIKLTLEPIIFVYKHPTIMKLFNSLHSNYEKTSVCLIFLIAFLFFMGFFKILTTLIKTTLQNFNDKWKHYETSIFTIALVGYTIIFALIYIHLEDIIYQEAKKEEFYTKEYYDVIGNKYMYVFLVIYMLSLFEFIIANYKIDKKCIAEWKEKNRQLQQFINTFDIHAIDIH